MRTFLEKLLNLIRKVLSATRKAWSGATPPAVPVTRDLLEPSDTPTAPARECRRYQHPGFVPDGKWIMRYHRGRH